MGLVLTPSQGLHTLSQLGVSHRDISIGNVLLGTDPEKAAGFISDLEFSSISEESIKAACPSDYDTVIKQLKDDGWGTVRDYPLDATLTTFSYILCAQGTVPFMSNSHLVPLSLDRSLLHRTTRSDTSDLTFQHGLCHDLESLIWVVVYAMMVHQRNIFAQTDSEMFELYKEELDDCWAGHAYYRILMSHDHMVMTGCSHARALLSRWLPDPREAAFFRDAMRLIRKQDDEEPITYEAVCSLFKDHINLAKEPRPSGVVSK